MNTAYFYVREVRSDGSTHRIGCIALGKTDQPGILNVSYSLASPGDAFNQVVAVKKAVGRLNSPSFARPAQIAKIDPTDGTDGLAYLLGQLEIPFKGMSRINTQLADEGLRGALQNLKEVVSTA